MVTVTVKRLRYQVTVLNAAAGNPASAWSVGDDGRPVARVGRYVLDRNAGGYRLCAIVNENGGKVDLTPRRPAGQCSELISAYAAGLFSGREGIADLADLADALLTAIVGASEQGQPPALDILAAKGISQGAVARINAARKAGLFSGREERAAMLAALRAIRARINGVFDDPALRAFGPLSTDAAADCAAIATAAIAKAQGKE